MSHVTSSRRSPRSACGPSHGGDGAPRGHHGSSCGRGNHACASGSCCAADMYASRLLSQANQRSGIDTQPPRGSQGSPTPPVPPGAARASPPLQGAWCRRPPAGPAATAAVAVPGPPASTRSSSPCITTPDRAFATRSPRFARSSAAARTRRVSRRSSGFHLLAVSACNPKSPSGTNPGFIACGEAVGLSRGDTRGTCGKPLDWGLFCLCTVNRKQPISQDNVLGTGE